MSTLPHGRSRLIVGVTIALVLMLCSGVVGYWWARRTTLNASTPDTVRVEQGGKRVLYWYDPMIPEQHFPKPGKSPMGMEMVPRYADETAETGGVRIDPNIVQNLGIRLVKVRRGSLSAPVEAIGSVVFDQRDIAIVQTRTSGFVTRVYRRAPGDVIPRNAPIVDLLVPEWAGAQSEFLALLASGDTALTGAARQRLALLGMPPEMIAQVESRHRAKMTITIRSPRGGVIESLDARQGMTVSSGSTVVRINGLAMVWLEAQIPEARGGMVNIGKTVEARLTAYPGHPYRGHVIAILPQANVETRTLTVRIELKNDDGRLRPGMFAQVRLEADRPEPVLYVPSESVIQTGRRAVVIVAADQGRYIPTEVTTGGDIEGKTIILQGVSDGQKVVASGQFLIDSEASLNGVLGRLGDGTGGINEPEGKEGVAMPSDAMKDGPMQHATP